MRTILSVIATLLVCVPFCLSAQDEGTSLLRAKYRALPKEQRREFLKKLTADQMDQFIHETVLAISKDKKPDEIRQGWEFLAMSTGSRFEEWGEKLLAEKRRLTRERILALLQDEKQDFAWRVAFHGYLRVIFKNTEPRDAYEIGLTKDEVVKLKDEIPTMQIPAPNKTDGE